MKNNRSRASLYIVSALTTVAVASAALSALAAYAPPTGPFPQGQPPAPLDTGAGSQTKLGPLTVGGSGSPGAMLNFAQPGQTLNVGSSPILTPLTATGASGQTLLNPGQAGFVIGKDVAGASGKLCFSDGTCASSWNGITGGGNGGGGGYWMLGSGGITYVSSTNPNVTVGDSMTGSVFKVYGNVVANGVSLVSPTGYTYDFVDGATSQYKYTAGQFASPQAGWWQTDFPALGSSVVRMAPANTTNCSDTTLGQIECGNPTYFAISTGPADVYEFFMSQQQGGSGLYATAYYHFAKRQQPTIGGSVSGVNGYFSNSLSIGDVSPRAKLVVSGIAPAAPTSGTKGALAELFDTSWGPDAGNVPFAGLAFGSMPGYDFAIGKKTVDGSHTYLQIRRQDGVELLTVATSGNTGIGTATPSYKLDVAGTVNAPQYCLSGNCITAWPAGGGGGGTGVSYPLSLPSNGTFDFNMVKDGWTGFNLSGSAANKRIILGVDAGRTSNVLDIEDTTNWNHKMELRADGSAYFQGGIGIGNTSFSPAALLDVNGGSGSQGLALRLTTGDKSGSNSPLLMWDATGFGGTPTVSNLYWMRQEGPNWVFNTSKSDYSNLTNVMTVTNTGNVGINTVTPSGKLVITNGVSNPTGSAGDAVSAYTNSTNAAVYAEQQNTAGYAGYFSGQVGATGNVTLFRAPGNADAAGPSIILQSAVGASTMNLLASAWVTVSTDANGNPTTQDSCPKSGSNGPDQAAANNNAYTSCVDGAFAGCTDVAKLGGISSYYSRSVQCATPTTANTQTYSIRANIGALEFLNSGGYARLTLDQGGNLTSVGSITSGYNLNVTKDATVNGNLSVGSNATVNQNLTVLGTTNIGLNVVRNQVAINGAGPIGLGAYCATGNKVISGGCQTTEAELNVDSGSPNSLTTLKTSAPAFYPDGKNGWECIGDVGGQWSYPLVTPGSVAAYAICGQVSVSGVGNLYNNAHTGFQCAQAGGTQTTQTYNGTSVQICQFSGGSCPSSWTQLASFTETVPTVGGSPYCAAHMCVTGSHSFSNTAVETCSYEGITGGGFSRVTCGGFWNNQPARVTSVGCY